MTLAPVKAGGWDAEEVLTSSQMNVLQATLIKAIDGVGGGTYTLLAGLVLQGALVRILDGLSIEGSTLDVAADAALQVDGTLSMSGLMNLDGSLDVISGGLIDVRVDAELKINNLGAFNVQNGGSCTWFNGSAIDIHSGVTVTLTSTAITLAGSMGVPGVINIENLGRLNVLSGGKILGSSGGEIQVFDAEDLTINGSSFVFRLTMTPTFFDPAWGQLVSGAPTWCMRDTTATSPIVFPLPLQPGDTLTTVRVTLRGGGGSGHGGVSPATPPRVQLISVSSAGVVTIIRQVDDSVTGAGYDSSHTITLTGSGLPLTVGTDPLYVRILSESGASRVDNTTVVTMVDGTGAARSFRGQNEVY